MKEPMRNFGFVCEKHAPKPQPQFLEKPLEWFVGKFVKKGFPAVSPEGRETQEHMWVKIESIQNGRLRGKLNNDPVYKMDLMSGDTVLVDPSEVEDVCE